MNRPVRRKRSQQYREVTQHFEPDDEHDLVELKEFLNTSHPSNDKYMRSLTLIQRQIMSLTHQLRSKQVEILKSVFSGMNYAEASRANNTTGGTVSKLVKSPDGVALLNALQYHQAMIEGANVAQRRNMLWRIAVAGELKEPKTTISAVEALNRMTFNDYTASVVKPKQGATDEPIAKTIDIDPLLLPRGPLDV